MIFHKVLAEQGQTVRLSTPVNIKGTWYTWSYFCHFCKGDNFIGDQMLKHTPFGSCLLTPVLLPFFCVSLLCSFASDLICEAAPNTDTWGQKSVYGPTLISYNFYPQRFAFLYYWTTYKISLFSSPSENAFGKKKNPNNWYFMERCLNFFLSRKIKKKYFKMSSAEIFSQIAKW